MLRRGFTLIETLIVIVMMGIVIAIAMPSMRTTMIKRNLRGSRNTLAALYAQARMVALQQGRSGAVRVESNRVFVTATPRLTAGVGTYDTIGAVRDLASEFGVTLAAIPNPLFIDAKGFMAEDAVLRTTKSGYTDSLAISRYGRVRK